MWASKIGNWAAAGPAPPSANSRTLNSQDLRIGGILSRAQASCRPRGPLAAAHGAALRHPRRPTHAARAVADALGVADRREHDPVRFGNALLVSAAATADDPRGRAAGEHWRRALELEELGLHLAAEGIVTPRPVAANDPVTRNDHRHRVGAQRVADGPRGARMADAARESRIRVDPAERDAPGLGEDPGLELGHAGEVDRHREKRPAAREILAQLLPRALAVRPGPRGYAVSAAPEL